MKKSAKIWLAAAGVLVLLGLGILTAALALTGWDFAALSTGQFETNTHEIGDKIHSISMETDTADIVFLPSADGVCRVVCHERETQRHAVDMQNGTLEIRETDTRAWHDHISLFSFGETRLTVYLPAGEYARLFIEESTGDIEIPADFAFESLEITASTGDMRVAASVSGGMKITTDTGDIRVEGASAEMLELSVTTGMIAAKAVDCAGDMTVRVSTGDARLEDVKCENLLSVGNTGDLFMENVIAVGVFSIERSTGDVTFEKCDAAEIFVKTDTGDVAGSLLSDKIFMVETDTGDVNIPKSVTGGKCEIMTDTGDVALSIG